MKAHKQRRPDHCDPTDTEKQSQSMRLSCSSCVYVISMDSCIRLVDQAYHPDKRWRCKGYAKFPHLA